VIPLTNDELIKLRSRIYRGYRAPLATSEFFTREQIDSISRDGSGNVTQMVQSYTQPDGVKVTKTTVFTLDPTTGDITSSTVTYNYDEP
jgi:hypothetical protein